MPLPREAWDFGVCPNGQDSFEASTTDICVFDGFEIGKVYELGYTAKDTVAFGLAYTSPRDIATFLKTKTEDDFGNPNPLAEEDKIDITQSYLMGASSTGMFIDAKGNDIPVPSNVRHYMVGGMGHEGSVGLARDYSLRSSIPLTHPRLVGTICALDTIFLNAF